MSTMPAPTEPASGAGAHAQHDMSSAPAMQMPTGHDHAGPAAHDAPAMQASPDQAPEHDVSSMAGHDMAAPSQAATDPPTAPPPPASLEGPVHAADTYYAADRMADARGIFRAEHGVIRTHRVLIDQLEARIRNGRDGYAWDGEAWYGGAIDRLWIKTEGEGIFGGGAERAEVQALWSRAIDPWFNLQAGIRYDFRPDPERGYLVLGMEGLAPYWFELDGALFLSTKGDLSARLEAENDQRITHRLILQPRVEFSLSLQDVPALRTGSGLSTAEAGLRLRYEIVPEFAPYVGVHYERAFGDTARFRRSAGEDAGGWTFLLGVRTWF
jgi:copper resistance protein B